MTSLNPILSLQDIHHKLSAAVNNHHLLKIVDGKLILLNRQGYEIDPSIQTNIRYQRSPLDELFSFIQREMKQAQDHLQQERGPISVELIQEIDRLSCFLYSKHKTKASSIFLIKNICNSIFGFLSDYRTTVFASIEHLHQEATLFSQQLDNEQLDNALRIKMGFEYLTTVMETEEQYLPEESFKSYQTFKSLFQRMEDSGKVYLDQWLQLLSRQRDEAPASSLKRCRLEIQHALLSHIIEQQDFDTDSYVTIRTKTRDLRNQIQKTLLKEIIDLVHTPKKNKEKESEESTGDEKTDEIQRTPRAYLEKLVFESCLRIGPQATADWLHEHRETSRYDYRKWPDENLHFLDHCLGYTYSKEERSFLIDEQTYQAFAVRMGHKKRTDTFSQQCTIFQRYFLQAYEYELDPEKKMALIPAYQSLRSFIAGKVTAEDLTSFLDSLQGFPALKKETAPLLETLLLLVEDPEKLRNLNLSGFGLGRLPGYLSCFTGLKKLNLSHNALRDLDSVDSSFLNQLEDLNLSDNRLEDLPEEFGEKLTDLNLEANLLKNVPACLLTLKNLERLNLNLNNLYELPTDWQNLRQCLTVLKMSHNSIGDISSLGQLEKLTHLHCNHNRITTFPDELVELPLITLTLRHNRIGSLPEMVETSPLVSKLRHFDCRENLLEKMPDSWGLLFSISTLRLAHNQLERLPERFVSQNIALVELSFNALSEISPYYICTPTSVHLKGNPLQAIPDFSEEITRKTRYLNLSNCRLQSIPSLSDLPLETLILSFNPIETLPKNTLPDTIKHVDLTGLTLKETELSKLEDSLSVSARNHEIKDQDQKKLTKLSQQKFLDADQLSEQKDLQKKLLSPVLLVDKGIAIPKPLQIFCENGRKRFGLQEKPAPNQRAQGIFVHQCETTGDNAYQQDGLVYAAIPCPSLTEEQTKNVVKDALQNMAAYFDQRLKNPNIRYHGEPITGGAMAAMGVLFRDKYYLTNIGDAQVQAVDRSLIERGLEANSLEELRQTFDDSNVNDWTITPSQDWLNAPQELVEDFRAKGGTYELIENHERRGDRAPTYSSIGDRNWPHITCETNDLIEIDASKYPILLLASDGIWDVLDPSMVGYLIAQTIWQGGINPQERLSHLPQSIAKANLHIRDLALSLGYSGAPHDNTACMIMYAKEARPDDHLMHLAVAYDGHGGNNSEGFVHYLVDKTPTVFKNCLEQLVGKLTPKISQNVSSLDKKILGCALVIILGAIFIPVESTFGASFFAAGAILLVSAIAFKIIRQHRSR